MGLKLVTDRSKYVTKPVKFYLQLDGLTENELSAPIIFLIFGQAVKLYNDAAFGKISSGRVELAQSAG